MNALRQEATELLAAMPEHKLLALIPYMKFLQQESQRNVRSDFDITKYAGSAGKLFGNDKEVDAYIKEMRDINSNVQRKRAALREIFEMREQSPFPKDFDYDKAREEALAEKYGHMQ